MKGTSGFAEKFAALGPTDAHGRSLRQLDLERRLLKYPCSYMIYSAAFAALPTEVRHAIYQRMRDVLATRADNTIVEILRDTLHDSAF